MLISLVLLGVLEYLWLHNEFRSKYRDMEDRLSHLLFSTTRDVEDSLIFSGLVSLPSHPDTAGRMEMVLSFQTTDSVGPVLNFTGKEMRVKTDGAKFRHPMRGALLRTIVIDSLRRLAPMTSVSTIVMHHILTDSSGEFKDYKLVSWQGGSDTVLSAAMSRPAMDVLAGTRMALVNPNYKNDIIHELLPHISFAVLLWLIVGAAFFYTLRNLRRQMQLNALRDEFVSNITHELKTPITTVGVALESLQLADELQSPQSRRYLEIGRGELNRLSLLVDRILHSRAPQLQYEKIDVSEVVNDVVESMKVQFDNRHAQVDVQFDDGNFTIRGDRTHLSGVLFNLLDNALKYSQDQPEITVHLTRSNGSVQLKVEDHGIGIPEGYRDKVFEKLFRVPNHGRHDVKGHGLGLSYVADVVKQHNGKIELDSEPGKGSVFSLTLPAWHEN